MPRKAASGSSTNLATEKMETAMNLLMKNVDKYYGKNLSDITKKDFVEVTNSFVKIQMLISEFLRFWINSTSTGPNAVLSVNKVRERIDVKLFTTGKLDFRRMRLLIMQLNLARIHLEGLDNILLHLDKFIEISEENINKELVPEMKIVKETIGRTRTSVKNDAELSEKHLKCTICITDPL